MARSAGLVLRVVIVARAGAAEARRRVADVLLRAAAVRAAPCDTADPVIAANQPSAPAGEKAA